MCAAASHVRECTTADCPSPHHTPYLHDEKTYEYGGQVNFIAKLKVKVDETKKTIIGEPHIELQKPIRGTSCRFSRRFSSSSLIRVQIKPNIKYKHGEYLMNYFRRPFIIHGRVFRAIFAKENSVLLFLTNEEWVAGSFSGFRAGCGIIRPPSNDLRRQPSADWRFVLNPAFIEFLQWFNSLDLNNHQVRARSFVAGLHLFILRAGDGEMGFSLGAWNLELSTRCASSTR